jgi:(p)ppGpp synthase/HD superfamily hydrolase
MEGISREELLTMSIGAVTEVHGSEGLHALFDAEADQAFADTAAREAFQRAKRLAVLLHNHDLRDREPYINHLLRVAIRIIRYYEVREADVVVAALLHDAVEDHPRSLADLATDAERSGGESSAALAVLARAFTPRVASLIDSVSNPEYAPDRDKHEQYREHVAESLERDPWARAIKLSDFTDNGAGLMYTKDADLKLRLARKYAPLVPILRDFATRADTPLSDAAKADAVEHIDLAEKRFRAILGTE